VTFSCKRKNLSNGIEFRVDSLFIQTPPSHASTISHLYDPQSRTSLFTVIQFLAIVAQTIGAIVQLSTNHDVARGNISWLNFEYSFFCSFSIFKKMKAYLSHWSFPPLITLFVLGRGAAQLQRRPPQMKCLDPPLVVWAAPQKWGLCICIQVTSSYFIE
jgi:hypothetical protein